MSAEPFAAVGRPMQKVDALDKVLGRSVYIDDQKVEGMAWGRTVMSPHPHARLKSLLTERALAVPGVLAVITAEHIPGKNEVGVVVPGQPLIAYDKVRYAGDCLALIAAESPEAAAHAEELLEIEYELLPGVFSPLDGIREGAPFIHDSGNIQSHLKLRRGNPDDGFAEAHIIVEDTFTVQHQEHAYLETNGAIAIPYPDGSITVYGSLQCPFYVQKAVAGCLGVPYNKVRVIQAVTGGGFGGKEDFPSEVIARTALMARLTGRPIKMILTREEDIRSSSKRHPMVMRYKVGADKSGKLLAVKAELYADCGAYATLSPVVLFRANIHAAGAYEVPHVHVDTYGVYTNQNPTGAMRGFGQPQVTLAMESLMDELARRLEIDPLELRLRNAWRLGSETATGQVLKESVSLVETLEKARAVTEWDEKRKLCKEDSCGSVRKGIGLACMGYGVSLGAKGWPIDRSGAHVQIWPDGSVSIGIGVIDMGQGTFTVISQIAAEGLQVSPDLIRINEVSTQVVPDSGPTVASRATVMGGNAVLDAISELKRRLSERAAVKLGVHVDDVVCGMESYEAGGKRISYRDLVKDCFLHNINLAAMGWYNAPHLEWDHEVFQGDAYFIYSFATHVAEVEVDEETGQVTVTKVTAVHDTGRTINPQLVEGQVEGGVVQGMGWAVCEDLKYRDGIPLTGSFSTYTIPTSLDSPTIETHLLENPYSAGPFGAKGIGEPCLIPQAPAVTNAISHALGIWVKDIPATPERIKEYMIRRDDGRS